MPADFFGVGFRGAGLFAAEALAGLAEDLAGFADLEGFADLAGFTGLAGFGGLADFADFAPRLAGLSDPLEAGPDVLAFDADDVTFFTGDIAGRALVALAAPGVTVADLEVAAPAVARSGAGLAAEAGVTTGDKCEAAPEANGEGLAGDVLTPTGGRTGTGRGDLRLAFASSASRMSLSASSWVIWPRRTIYCTRSRALSTAKPASPAAALITSFMAAAILLPASRLIS